MFRKKNIETYITFSISIEKGVTRIDKNGEEITKTISNRLQFIDCARFMASSLSDLVDKLAEEFHKIKCRNFDMCCLEYTNAKGDFIEYKCLSCNKNLPEKLDENLKKRFFNTYKVAEHDISNFAAAVLTYVNTAIIVKNSM